MSLPSGFNEGDVVLLKSGGRIMTVDDNRTDGLVSTVWMDSTGVIIRDAFTVSMLINITTYSTDYPDGK